MIVYVTFTGVNAEQDRRNLFNVFDKVEDALKWYGKDPYDRDVCVRPVGDYAFHTDESQQAQDELWKAMREVRRNHQK